MAHEQGSPEWLEVERFFTKKDRGYAKAYLEEQARYEKFHEECRRGIHACRIERAAVANVDERISSLLSEVQKNISTKVQAHRQERHGAENEIWRRSEETIEAAKVLMLEEQKTRVQSNVYAEEVTNEICHLYNDLDQARKYRIQKSEKLQEVVKSKLEEIHIALEAEKKIREESTHTILELFGQMGTKMQKEIDKTKAERQEKTDRLVHLMEVVLPHLETARSSHVKAVEERLEDHKAAKDLATDLSEKFTKKQSIMKRCSLQTGVLSSHSHHNLHKHSHGSPHSQSHSDSSGSGGSPGGGLVRKATLSFRDSTSRMDSVAETEADEQKT